MVDVGIAVVDDVKVGIVDRIIIVVYKHVDNYVKSL